MMNNNTKKTRKNTKCQTFNGKVRHLPASKHPNAKPIQRARQSSEIGTIIQLYYRPGNPLTWWCLPLKLNRESETPVAAPYV
jgi:hypothetical protein